MPAHRRVLATSLIALVLVVGCVGGTATPTPHPASIRFRQAMETRIIQR